MGIEVERRARPRMLAAHPSTGPPKAGATADNHLATYEEWSPRIRGTVVAGLRRRAAPLTPRVLRDHAMVAMFIGYGRSSHRC